MTFGCGDRRNRGTVSPLKLRGCPWASGVSCCAGSHATCQTWVGLASCGCAAVCACIKPQGWQLEPRLAHLPLHFLITYMLSFQPEGFWRECLPTLESRPKEANTGKAGVTYEPIHTHEPITAVVFMLLEHCGMYEHERWTARSRMASIHRAISTDDVDEAVNSVSHMAFIVDVDLPQQPGAGGRAVLLGYVQTGNLSSPANTSQHRVQYPVAREPGLSVRCGTIDDSKDITAMLSCATDQ